MRTSRFGRLLGPALAISCFTSLVVAECFAYHGKKACCTMANVQLWVACSPTCHFTGITNPQVDDASDALPGQAGRSEPSYQGAETCLWLPSTCADGYTCTVGTESTRRNEVCFPKNIKGSQCTGTSNP